VRYVADASYWIYLLHLPVVVVLQILVGHLPLHWTVKIPGILAASLLVLFASYHYLVRATFIGQVLNGRRYPRVAPAAPSATASAEASAPALSPDDDSAVMARLAGVHKRYGKTVALAGLDLDVRRGELLAVLGPNGAGKSTAIALWLGLLEPDQGTARLLGGSPLEIDGRRHVGVMMQDVALTPELRVRELIAQTASYYAAPLTVADTLALTRLEALADRPYGKLSGGQKRLVQFALAVCGAPRLLFLDEPTVGLDVEARETIWRTIRGLIARGCSIVLTTHYLEEAEALADSVAVVAAGRLIASGTVADIRSLVARKHITCTSTLSDDEVRRWPEIVAVRRDADRLAITVVDAENVVRRLLAADAGLRDLEIRQAGLADAFTQLTKEAA
jgi:ABC-type multidrug transport system ATPase subunit